MPPVFEFKCDECGSRFESTAGGDRLEACRNDDCPGVPLRVWAVNFNRVPGGGRRRRG